jgi:hypothetical protein
MAQEPMTISQMMQAYQQLTDDFQAKRMDKASYSAALTRLMAIDDEKRWWSCTLQDGFVWHDGSRWIPGQPVVNPPGVSPSQAPVQAAPVAAQKTYPPLKGWQLIASTPILAILPGAVIGGLWFLYTLLRRILSGTGSVDILTPAILTGLPLLLWLLRKPLDKILLPLQKILGSFPYALRLIVALAIPIMFGCGCAAISTTGNTAMFLTALSSTLFGYFLLHKPAAKKI